MAEEKASKPSTPASEAQNKGSVERLEKSYRGIGLDQAYREGSANYRGVEPAEAPLPPPPLRGAPAKAAPASAPADSGDN